MAEGEAAMMKDKPNRRKSNKWIDIDFYWEEDAEKYKKDPGTYTHHAQAQIGRWDGKEDDTDQATFYYFDSEDHLKLFMDPSRQQEEFIVTRWRYI